MKKQKSEEKEESELEEEIENSEEDIDNSSENREIRTDISDIEFIEFLNPSENKSPSLEQVGIAKELRATDLEQGVSEIGNLDTNKKEEEGFKYLPELNSEEEKKYDSQKYSLGTTTSLSKMDIANLGREQNILPRQIEFSSSESSKTENSLNDREKYSPLEKKDITQLGKGNIFEKKEIKYTPSEEY